jgi:RHS repeat-associated protein
MNRWVAAIFFLFSLVFLVATSSLAQTDPAAGVIPFSTRANGVYESVDLASSNIFVQLPIRQKPGKVPFSYSFVVNSSMYPVGFDWLALSETWGLQIGATAQPVLLNALVVTASGSSTTYSSFYIPDTAGASHYMLPSVSITCPSSSVVTAPVIDGSGFVAVLSCTPSISFKVYDRFGNLYPKASGSPSTATVLQDPDGATIQQLATGETATGYTDTLGQTALIVPVSYGPGEAPAEVEYTDAAGNLQVFTINSSSYTLQTAFGCSSMIDTKPSSISLPSSLTTPSGNVTITYETTPGDTHSPHYVTGRLAGIGYPTGGSVSFAYSGGNNGIDCNSFVVPTLTKTVNDGNGNVNTWTYVNSNNSATSPSNPNYNPTQEFTVTVTGPAPANNQTVYHFAQEFQTEAQYYQGPATGTPLKTVVTCYNGNNSSESGCISPSLPPHSLNPILQPITQTDVYTSLGTSPPSLVETLYDVYQNVTSVKDYDFGATYPPSGLALSETITSYDNPSTSGGPYPCGTLTVPISNLPCSVATLSPAPNNTYKTIASTTYTYNSTGHPTETSKLVSEGTFLDSSATYNSNGTINVATDVNGATATYAYTGCSPVLPTNVTTAGGSVNLSSSKTWDCNGGVSTSVTDENGSVTKTNFTEGGAADPYYRPLSMVDPLGNTTAATYTTKTFESSMNFNGSTSTTDQLITSDGLGRQIFGQQRQGQGGATFDSVQTKYSWNSIGPVTTQSVSYPGTAGESAPGGTAVTTTEYDAIGRPVSVTDGGGGVTSYSYVQKDVLVTVSPAPSGENTKVRQYEFDGMGRLTSVCEVTSASGSGAGSCGQSNSATGFLTRYGYDGLGDLVEVSQNSQPGAVGGLQTRSYAYDGLGRPTSEINPETANLSTTYTYDTDGTCGTYYGDIVKKIDSANNVTCYTHDALHRLTGITYPSGPYASKTPPKAFIYDATTFSCANSNVKGRLAEAFTGTSSAKITDIAYCYSSRGEITDTFESTPNSGTTPYHTVVTYWANGVPNTLGGVPGLSGWTFTPDGEGRLYSAVYGTSTIEVKSTTYYPTNPQTTVTFGNGDADVYGYDANTGRMNSFQFKVGATPKTLTGTMSWNANGTLGSLGLVDQFNTSNTQTCSYAHDDLTRIHSVNCASGSTNIWNQSFTLDPFGNISKSGSSSFAASYQPASGATNNREQSVGSCVPGYDADGNLTKDCTFSTPATYAWDADGNATALNGVGLTYDAFDQEAEIASGSTHTQILYGPIGKLGAMNGQTALTIRIPLPGGSQIELLGSTGSSQNVLHSDWLGSSRLSTNYTNRSESYDTAYAPYGENYAGSGGSIGDLNFTGQSQDTLLGLYDFLYREYNPVQGRWIRPDPSGLAAVDTTNPQSWNRYAYVLNNPLRLVDPMGLVCIYLNFGGDALESQDVQSEPLECSQNGGIWFNGMINTSSLQFDPNSDYVYANGTAGNNQFSCPPGGGCGQDALNAFVNSVVGSNPVMVYAQGTNTGTIQSGLSFLQTVQWFENNGLSQHPIEGSHDPWHPGQLNLRDSQSVCSTHVTLQPNSGQTPGQPTTGEFHVDTVNPWANPVDSYLTPGAVIGHGLADVLPGAVRINTSSKVCH